MKNKHLVLYADDDVDDLTLITEVFANHPKVELLTFSNGLEVLSFLQGLPEDVAKPCLIILDINMPILDGKDTLVSIRKNPAFVKVPILLFTTSNQPREKQFAYEYNAGFITKPINVTQLENIAEIFIDHCTEEVKSSIRSFHSK
ncbi:response regulator [Aridibaculum aurantiacum]|uniref:response regulator n=1 Tax=Aridibaculum aurantiacum TaxID=2810307 RepID=UPI001A974EA7|nr:response regulator [Aridibaculum aurantiacum]